MAGPSAAAPPEDGGILGLVTASDSVTAEAEWFVGGHNRDDVRTMAQNLLEHGEIGDFLVRELSKERDGFGLVIKTPAGLRNYKIERTARGDGATAFCLRGGNDDELFDSVSALIYHYATTRDGVAGTQLLLREDDLVQYGRALKDNAEQYGIDEFSARASWFASGTDRTELKAKLARMLEDGKDGDFLIRDVASDPGNFGMSIKMSEGKMPNYLIERQVRTIAGGDRVAAFKLRGARDGEVFSSLAVLVYYYATAEGGVMGHRLWLPPNDLDRLADFCRKKSPDEYASLEQIECGATEVDTANAALEEQPGENAARGEAEALATATEALPTASSTAVPREAAEDDVQEHGKEYSALVSQLVNTQRALVEEAPPPSDALLLLYTVTFGMGPTTTVPDGTSVSISLHGSRGSTSMRPVPSGQTGRLFRPSKTTSIAVVMEDVGQIDKVGLGLHIKGHADARTLWTLKFIDVVSSTGERWRADRDLSFSTMTGFYHEVLADGTGFSVPTASASPAAQAAAEMSIIQGALAEAKQLKVVRSKHQTTASLTHATEGLLHDYRLQQGKLQSSLAQNHNRNRQIETLQAVAKEQTDELTRRIEQLAAVFRRAEAEAARDREKARAVDGMIKTSNHRVLAQTAKLDEIKAKLERARQSTKEDQSVLRQLDEERKRLAGSLTEEEGNLAVLLKAKEIAYGEVKTFKEVLRQKQRQLEVTSNRLSDTAADIRQIHLKEQALQTSIIRDEHRLQRLEAKLIQQRAAEADLRLRGGRSHAVMRGRKRAAVERKVRDAARGEALRTLASTDFATEATLPADFFKAFEGAYADILGAPSKAEPQAGPSRHGLTLREARSSLENTLAMLGSTASPVNGGNKMEADEEEEEYGFGADDCDFGADDEAVDRSGVDTDNVGTGSLPLNEAPPPTITEPKTKDPVAKRFAQLRNLWGATAEIGGHRTLARNIKKDLDSELHGVDGAVVTN
eukprot:CAMPEP_0182918574 /NCGR_PEP_ID=MMETSP0105_2-20130417/2172_1 /TAXON_ID=81532 ORGANISM="Acanthoeca-like sp., Strain 10tr" /NCGR_SAMPLE_ID=MMETSP0105_2 /ASSEMBLY_ACC=CAM_ASM_000205 /LENGTH=971 /DNA_ID=CAMNT_0025055673 /DNA_START=20 /DNA_END=2935 /DNA_ORIENTATION=-